MKNYLPHSHKIIMPTKYQQVLTQNKQLGFLCLTCYDLKILEWVKEKNLV